MPTYQKRNYKISENLPKQSSKDPPRRTCTRLQAPCKALSCMGQQTNTCTTRCIEAHMLVLLAHADDKRLAPEQKHEHVTAGKHHHKLSSDKQGSHLHKQQYQSLYRNTSPNTNPGTARKKTKRWREQLAGNRETRQLKTCSREHITKEQGQN